jgi:hypothetical protein
VVAAVTPEKAKVVPRYEIGDGIHEIQIGIPKLFIALMGADWRCTVTMVKKVSGLTTARNMTAKGTPTSEPMCIGDRRLNH